jgi:hypothetical protein
VSFWNVSPEELRYDVEVLGIDPSDAVGWCISDGPDYGFQIPEIHSRICIWAAKLLTDWRGTAGRYYNFPQHQAEWPAAFNQMIAWLIQHESGHSIAMPHELDPLNWYMYPSVPIQYDSLQPNYGKFFPPGTVFDYDNISKSKFTITPQEP